MNPRRRQPDEVTTRMAALTAEEEEGSEVPLIRILARPSDHASAPHSLYDADAADGLDRDG